MTDSEFPRRYGKALSATRLRARLDPARVPYADSTRLPRRSRFDAFQPRAVQALELSLAIDAGEFNVFVAGDPNTGRTHFVLEYLQPRAAKAPAPSDWLYLHNFDDPDRPTAVSLPPGMGRKFKIALTKAIADIRSAVPPRLDQETYRHRHEELYKTHHRRREALFNQMEKLARKRSFKLDLDENGSLTLSPVMKGKVVGEEAYAKLPARRKNELKRKGDDLLSEIGQFMRRIGQSEQGLKENELDLQRNAVRAVVEEHTLGLRKAFKGNAKLDRYLDALVADMIQNVEYLLPREPQAAPPSTPAQQDHQTSTEDHFARYDVNLFVDNASQHGAPVILDPHPTTFNLLGSIEREAELGAFYTDFTLIKAGSLHRANGGYLILNMEDVLANPGSWEGLLRALRLGAAHIEDPVDPDQVRSRTIEPDPIPLRVRILLIGTDETYEALLYHDDRFRKYFKLKAHLSALAPRTMQTIRTFLSVIGRIVMEAELLPFSREALAALVDESSRLAEDQKRLSLSFPELRERMMEASVLAKLDGREQVEASDLVQAVANRDFRANLFEDEFMSDYDREIIKVSTMGSAVGMANGLSVTLFGDYEFGLPHQISCTVGVGHGGIIDLEREAQLGGPIHTKGMMILKSYLTGHFAQNKPIVMAGSLCFEQSYAGIEGDSASGAELAALLSALSGTPIDLSLAFTGAVSQSGAIMAVGGLNRKIEGFFEVCRRRGLTGRQGVLLPVDNVGNLMLKDEVVTAVAEGHFHIYPVRTIEQAMEVLTGMPAGQRRKDGRFPTGTLYHLVDQRLAELVELASAAVAKGESHR